MLSTFRAILAAACLACGATAQAQYSTVTSPFNNVSNSFFEHFGVGFGFRGDGFFFNQNGAGAALPPFGNFDPNAGATFGFGGPNAFLSISASQGSTSSMTSQSPSVTVPNGIPGSIFEGLGAPLCDCRHSGRWRRGGSRFQSLAGAFVAAFSRGTID